MYRKVQVLSLADIFERQTKTFITMVRLQMLIYDFQF